MYREIEPFIDNTICEERIINDEVILYRIRAAEGYKLHESTLDTPIIDDETHEETGKIRLGFTKSYITAGPNYDFETNTRKIYAKPEDYEEIINIEMNDNLSEIEEKARAYDILMGVTE